MPEYISSKEFLCNRWLSEAWPVAACIFLEKEKFKVTKHIHYFRDSAVGQ